MFVNPFIRSRFKTFGCSEYVPTWKELRISNEYYISGENLLLNFKILIIPGAYYNTALDRQMCQLYALQHFSVHELPM